MITGAAGNIGSALTETLSDGYNVVGLDLPDACEGRDGLIGCDITDPDSTERAIDELYDRIDGGNIASVIHLAAYFDFSGKERLQIKPSTRMVTATSYAPCVK